MHESLVNSAQLTFNATIDAEPLCRLVDVARDAGEAVTMADFIARAYVDMLVEMPAFNATVEGDVMTVFAAVNLGIAVATPAHLVVPVITFGGAAGCRWTHGCSTPFFRVGFAR